MVLVVDQTLTMVSRSQGELPATSDVPPHRSTTVSPSTTTAQEAPRSPSVKFFSNAVRTVS